MNSILFDYKREIRCSKTSIESIDRICRMLSKDPKNLSFVQKNDGAWTASKEKLEVIINTPFPNCVYMDRFPLGVAYPIIAAGMIPHMGKITIRLGSNVAISSFERFKPPGPDVFGSA